MIVYVVYNFVTPIEVMSLRHCAGLLHKNKVMKKVGKESVLRESEWQGKLELMERAIRERRRRQRWLRADKSKGSGLNKMT